MAGSAPIHPGATASALGGPPLLAKRVSPGAAPAPNLIWVLHPNFNPSPSCSLASVHVTRPMATAARLCLEFCRLFIWGIDWKVKPPRCPHQQLGCCCWVVPPADTLWGDCYKGVDHSLLRYCSRLMARFIASAVTNESK